MKKASDTLENYADSEAIAPEQKREIEQLTQKSDAVLEEIEQEIEGETEKLIDLESE